MAWYNGGNWDALDAETIPEVLVDLCNAINERHDCLGKTRYAWRVNTGTEASPTLGTKSTNLSATDFYGLNFMSITAWTNAFTLLLSLLNPTTGFDWNSRHSGWSKTGTDTGLNANGDLWTVATIAADAGLSVTDPPEGIFDQNAAEFMKASLDRMIYPVIYPKQTATGSIVGNSYATNTDDADGPFTSPTDAWAGKVGVTSTLGSGHARAHMFRSEPVPGLIHYGASLLTGATITVSNLYNQSGAGYLGSISKQWAHMYVRSLKCTGITLQFLGGSESISDADYPSVEFAVTTPIPLNGSVESFCGFSAAAPFPFAAWESGDGIPYAAVGIDPTFKVASGYEHLRQILDISGELTDQA